MYEFKTILLYVLLFANSYEQIEARKRVSRNKKIINLEFIEDCNEGKYPIVLNNTKVLDYGYLKAVNADLYVLHPGYNRLGGRFELKKCQTSTDKKCPTLITGKLDVCKAYVEDNQFYTDVFKYHVQPKLKCPINQNVYRVRNASFDTEKTLSALPLLPAEYYKYHWNVLIEYFENAKPQKILGCLNLMFIVDTVKN